MSGSGQTLFRGFSAGKLTEEGEQGGSSASDWNTYTEPPMVTAEGVPVTPQPASGMTAGGVFDTVAGLAGKLLNIFQPAQQQYRPYPNQQAPQQGVPTWVWVAIPVALVGAVVLLRRPQGRRMARYHRRSRK